MLLESTQLLSNAVNAHSRTPQNAPYKPMYMQHPCTKWVLASRQHFLWLLKHADQINIEYQARYGKMHACEKAIMAIKSEIPSLKFPSTKFLGFSYVMPTIYRTENVVSSYRSYVKDAKLFAKWGKLNNTPRWYTNHKIEYNEHEIRACLKARIPIPQLAFSRYCYPQD